MAAGIACIADGELLAGADQGPLASLESPWIQNWLGRARKHDQVHAWKNEERQAGLLSATALWGRQGARALNVPRVVALSAGPCAGELVYAVQAEQVLSLLKARWRPGQGLTEEVRLASEAGRSVASLAHEPGGERLACAIRGKTGTLDLALMGADGKGLRLLTDGDSQDDLPVWNLAEPDTLCFQSQGIARGAEGAPVGLGPSRIERLELGRQRLVTLLEDAATDYLSPRFSADGTLHYIRRPYQAGLGRTSVLSSLSDALLAPVRLGAAVVGWLDHFTRRYGQQSLRHNEQKEQIALRDVLARRRGAVEWEPFPRPEEQEGRTFRVPADWVLIRRTGGREEVLAESVLHYDLLPGGGLVYTDGSHLVWAETGGLRRRSKEPLRASALVTLELPA